MNFIELINNLFQIIYLRWTPIKFRANKKLGQLKKYIKLKQIMLLN